MIQNKDESPQSLLIDLELLKLKCFRPLTILAYFALNLSTACSNGTVDGVEGNTAGNTMDGGNSGSPGSAGTSGGGSAASSGNGGSGASTTTPDGWENPDLNQGTGGSAPAGFTACAETGAAAQIVSADDSNFNGGLSSGAHGNPQWVIVPRGDSSFDIAYTQSGDSGTIKVSHVEKSGDDYAIVWTLSADSLGFLAGYAIDEDGLPLIATAIDENISRSPTPSRQNRDGILQLVKINSECKEIYRQDLRADFDGSSRTPVYEPLTAGTSKLSAAGGNYVLHFSQMMEFDESVGQRHQMGRAMMGSTVDGTLKLAPMNLSHSFDQRVISDGNDFVLMALGDANIRAVQLSKISPPESKMDRTLFSIKGDGPTNAVYTQLGGSQSSKTGYVHLISTEKNLTTESSVNDSRNIAFFHTPKKFEEVEQKDDYLVTIVDTLNGNSQAKEWEFKILDWWNREFPAKNSGVLWLTDYNDAEELHATRPKIVRWGEDRFFILWEKWTRKNYVETMAAIVDEFGHFAVEAKSIGDARLSPPDEAILLNGEAAWVESHGGKAYLHTVNTELNHRVQQL